MKKSFVSLLLLVVISGLPLQSVFAQVAPLVNQVSSQEAPVEAAPKNFYKEDIWKDPDRGFFFYPPDPEPARVVKKPPEAKPEPKKEDPVAKAPKKFEEMTTSKEIREEHDRLLDQAIVKPNNENVLAYHQFKTKMLNQSERFAAVTQSVIWNNPDIDYNATKPTASFANVNSREKTVEFENDLLKQFARDYGMLFFFRSDCAYCHEQVPILGEISYKYGMEILGVSLDGKPIANVNKWVPDNGIAMRVSEGKGIKVTPSIYLVAKDKSHSIFLGSGILAMDDFGYRLRLLTIKKAEDAYKPAYQDSRVSSFVNAKQR